MTKIVHRISGELLSRHIGDEVILLGSVVKVGTNGTNLELKTSDKMLINVLLSEPPDEIIEGYVEIHGIPKSKTTIACNNIVRFPEEMTTTFDNDQYNELMVIYNTLGRNKWRMTNNMAILDSA